MGTEKIKVYLVTSNITHNSHHYQAGNVLTSYDLDLLGKDELKRLIKSEAITVIDCMKDENGEIFRSM